MKNRVWWAEEWTCAVCQATIRKHHKSRHLKSVGHVLRSRPILDSDEDVLSSDAEFSAFLAGVTARSFCGAEGSLYRAARRLRQQKEMAE